MIEVYINSSEENRAPDLALRAERVLEDRWNGWLRPIATADAFGDFLARWRANDPNGTWGYVTELPGSGDTEPSLIYIDPETGEPDPFPFAGRRADGIATYDLSGWVWISSTPAVPPE